MAAVTPGIGQGITWAFGTYTMPTNTKSISLSGASRDTYDASHLGTTGAKPFLASKSFDPGEVSIEHHYDTDLDWTIPIAVNTITNLTITWPDAETTVLAAWCTGFEGDADEGVMMGTIKFKLSQTITI